MDSGNFVHKKIIVYFDFLNKKLIGTNIHSKQTFQNTPK